MQTSTLKKVHKLAAIAAFLLVITFFTSSIIADLFASYETIAMVKQTIQYSVILLVLSMMATGISANKLYGSKGKGLMATKQKRMKIAAANGLFVLLPAALILAHWSSIGQFDSTYWTVQSVELIAGAINATMLGLNIRDGIKMGQKKAAKVAA